MDVRSRCANGPPLSSSGFRGSWASTEVLEHLEHVLETRSVAYRPIEFVKADWSRDMGRLQRIELYPGGPSLVNVSS